MRTAVIKNLIAGKPILVIFDVTKLCNERCPMCNIWKSRSADMDLEHIKDKAGELKRFGIGYVFLQGGEPTLRKDLIEIIDSFIENSIKPTVITNGILLDRARARQIAERPCNLAISIDSLDRERFARLRGVDALEKVKRNVEALTDLRRKGNWSITTTVSSLSEEEDIFAIKRYASDNGYMHAIRPYIHVAGHAGKKVAEMDADRQKVIRIFERYLQSARKENYLACTIYKKHLEYLYGKEMPLCDALKYSLLMKETGDFSPCIEYPMIDIRLQDITQAYAQHCKSFRECNKNTPCFYNDAREIGILWRQKWDLLLHSPQIIAQLLKYGNFF